MQATADQMIDYIKDGEPKTGKLHVTVQVNTTSGFDSICGEFMTSEGISYPFIMDYFMHRIIDGDINSATYSNIIKFVPDLYDQLLHELYDFASLCSSLHYMISKMIIPLDEPLRVPTQQELEKLSVWDLYSNFGRAGENEMQFYFARSGQGEWETLWDLSPIDKTIVVASYIHRDIDDFSNLELERFFTVVSPFARDYTCEVKRCYANGMSDNTPDYISSLDLDGYHSLITSDSFNSIMHDLFDIECDSKHDINRYFAQAYYDPIIDGFLVYNRDGDGVHGSHGAFIIEQVIENGSGYVEYIPLSLNRWNNDYFDVNGIRIEITVQGLYEVMDRFQSDIEQCIASYPYAFPTYRLYLQCENGHDVCQIQSIQKLVE